MDDTDTYWHAIPIVARISGFTWLELPDLGKILAQQIKPLHIAFGSAHAVGGAVGLLEVAFRWRHRRRRQGLLAVLVLPALNVVLLLRGLHRLELLNGGRLVLDRAGRRGESTGAGRSILGLGEAGDVAGGGGAVALTVREPHQRGGVGAHRDTPNRNPGGATPIKSGHGADRGGPGMRARARLRRAAAILTPEQRLARQHSGTGSRKPGTAGQEPRTKNQEKGANLSVRQEQRGGREEQEQIESCTKRVAARGPWEERGGGGGEVGLREGSPSEGKESRR